MRPIVIADEVVTDSAVRRLMSDAGDDIDDLMTLCEADITSKNEVRKKRFLENFRVVREKLTDLKEKDYKRLLQPCIDGNEIMEMFHLRPCREVGTLKQTLKDASSGYFHHHHCRAGFVIYFLKIPHFFFLEIEKL